MFDSDGGGIFSRAADGTGTLEQLLTSATNANPQAVSPDGTPLSFRRGPPTAADLHPLTLTGDRPSAPLIATPFSELNAEISPDGRLVAYQSNASGRAEIYVQPFPDVNQGRWQVSTTGGSRPLWSRDGRELFYWTDDGVRWA